MHYASLITLGYLEGLTLLYFKVSYQLFLPIFSFQMNFKII